MMIIKSCGKMWKGGSRGGGCFCLRVSFTHAGDDDDHDNCDDYDYGDLDDDDNYDDFDDRGNDDYHHHGNYDVDDDGDDKGKGAASVLE